MSVLIGPVWPLFLNANSINVADGNEVFLGCVAGVALPDLFCLFDLERLPLSRCRSSVAAVVRPLSTTAHAAAMPAHVMPIIRRICNLISFQIRVGAHAICVGAGLSAN